ncbi:polymorphic toxin type 22 domain-containing protein [Cupriavidus sp. L7L]|uniref:polymorphic toxin type 22 domain-containing protein n=1 Tax=Cupriavidus sp. L7L TaxID=2546443 RepID=UPI00352E1D86
MASTANSAVTNEPWRSSWQKTAAGSTRQSKSRTQWNSNGTTKPAPASTPTYSSANPYAPDGNACISSDCIPQGRPNSGSDYLTIQGNFYIVSGGAAINLHNGDTFGQWAVGRGYPYSAFKPGLTVTFGNIIGGTGAADTSNFLQGDGGSASAYFPLPAAPIIGVGGGLNHSYGGKTSVEYGISVPRGAGGSPLGYGFPAQ